MHLEISVGISSKIPPTIPDWIYRIIYLGILQEFFEGLLQKILLRFFQKFLYSFKNSPCFCLSGNLCINPFRYLPKIYTVISPMIPSEVFVEIPPVTPAEIRPEIIAYISAGFFFQVFLSGTPQGMYSENSVGISQNISSRTFSKNSSLDIPRNFHLIDFSRGSFNKSSIIYSKDLFRNLCKNASRDFFGYCNKHPFRNNSRGSSGNFSRGFYINYLSGICVSNKKK